MFEPPYATVPLPLGGWPRLLVRLELVAPEYIKLYEVIYDLAAYARQHRVGCITRYHDVDLLAYPHQSVSDIQRTFHRLIQEKTNGSTAEPLAATG